jgi:Putative prokaryotic signal transducing protein
MPDLVTIARYRDLPEAWIAKGKLESAGVPCFLADDNIVRMNWMRSNAFGGVRLRVGDRFAAAASALLNQAPPERLPAPGSEYIQPRCPRCESLVISHIAVHPMSYLLLWMGFPVLVRTDYWQCDNCDATWKWEGSGEYDDQPATPPHV